MKVIFERELVLTPDMMARRAHRPPVALPRTPGVHVQAVNKYLGIAAGKLSDSDDDGYPFQRFTPECYPLMPALGVAWEEFRASLYADDELLWQWGELERDGIYGTPDGLWLVDPKTAVWECKRTSKKMQSVGDVWMYMKQGMSYCAMLGQNRTKYDVLWDMGDYSRPYQPKSTEALVEFSDKEIEDWWRIVVKAAAGVKAEGTNGQI